MARKNLKEGALLAPVPPVLVTVGEGEEANIITIAWTGILATHPPRTYVSVRPSRHSYSLLKKTGEFVINLPPSRYAKEIDFCGIYTGAKVDKFEKCGFTRTESATVGAPTIAECPLALECKVIDVMPMGTHDVFVADIVSVSCDDSILDSDGKLCLERADLLAYMHGEYFKLGESLGTFGFSAKKSDKVGAVSRKIHFDNKKSASQAEKSAHDGAGVDDDHKKRPFYLDIAKKNTKRAGGVSKKRTKRSKNEK